MDKLTCEDLALGRKLRADAQGLKGRCICGAANCPRCRYFDWLSERGALLLEAGADRLRLQAKVERLEKMVESARSALHELTGGDPCLGCRGGSVHHTCGKSPNADSRLKPCLGCKGGSLYHSCGKKPTGRHAG